MSISVAISVEGQTEESFVKQVLSPFFIQKNIYLTPIIVNTKMSALHCKGGTISFDKAILDIKKLLNPKFDLVTTFYDYYGLHKDFIPANLTNNPYENIQLIEENMRKHISNEKFLPYIQLHEFEAFLFIDKDITISNLMNCNKHQVEKELSKALRESMDNPELVNNSPNTAPSKRIERVYSNYQKVINGTNICKDLGINYIMAKCPHFNEWINKIIEFAQ